MCASQAFKLDELASAHIFAPKPAPLTQALHKCKADTSTIDSSSEVRMVVA
jgi:hypothetical protein